MIKRIIFTLTILWLTFLKSEGRDFTYTYENQTVSYTVLSEEDKTCMTQSGSGDSPGNQISGKLILPSTVSDENEIYTLIEIGQDSFKGCWLSTVEIPNTVRTISNGAFMGCSGLTSLTIPGSINRIGTGAFKGCMGVKNLNIEKGDSAITIEDDNSLTGLEVLNLDRDVNKTTSFQGLTTLTILNISNNVTNIYENMFSNCSSLRSLTIPETVEVIGERAFYGCISLKSINIQDGFTPLRVEASTLSDGRGSTFAQAPIQTIYLGRNIEYTSTELSPFKNTVSLTDLTIGNKVTAINNYLFYGCTEISNMAVPSSVITIGDYSFYDCTNSTLLIISSSVESIGEYAFYNCRGLKDIMIPNSVLTIGDYAFRSCVGAEKIKIGEKVRNIGAYSFLDCRSVTDLHIGESVEKIGDNAFYNCNSLERIIIPDRVEEIGNNAFALCVSAEKVLIGSSVKKIGSRAFADCQGLQEVECVAVIPPVADSTTFSDYSPVLIVPEKSVSRYKFDIANCWPLFHNIMDVSGISEVSAESGDRFTIYDYSGMVIKRNCLSEELRTLPSGVYILKSDTSVQTVIIR